MGLQHSHSVGVRLTCASQITRNTSEPLVVRDPGFVDAWLENPGAGDESSADTVACASSARAVIAWSSGAGYVPRSGAPLAACGDVMPASGDWFVDTRSISPKIRLSRFEGGGLIPVIDRRRRVRLGDPPPCAWAMATPRALLLLPTRLAAELRLDVRGLREDVGTVGAADPGCLRERSLERRHPVAGARLRLQAHFHCA
jgi:hypothetical protein